MSENSNKEKVEAKAEEVKSEATASDTVKTEAKNTSSVILDMIKNPIDTLKKLSNDTKRTGLVTSIVLLIIWATALLICSFFSGYFTWDFSLIISKCFSAFKAMIGPLLGIIALTVIVLLIQGKTKKRSFATILSVMTLAHLPSIAASILSLLNLFSVGVAKLTLPIVYFASCISFILTYFAVKYLFKEDQDSKAFYKFAIVMGIFYIVYFIFSFFGIYM